MAGSSTKLGVLLPTRGLVIGEREPRDMDLILSMAERVEEAGLDSVWVGDSLTFKPRPEALTTLAAVAARTRRVRLGTAILIAALRHPVMLANILSTVDLASRGRTVLGIGLGGTFIDIQRKEWVDAGVDPSGRASRLEEMISIVRGLGTGDPVSLDGKHFSLDSVKLVPRTVQEGGIPLLLACHWRSGREAQFRRAARYGDGVISISDTPEEFARCLDRVAAYAGEEGRDFDSMEKVFYITVNLRDDESAAAEEAERFMMLYYGSNIWGDRWGPWGPAEKTIERIRQYAAAGADTVIVRFASFDQETQLDTFLSDVVPAFR